MTALLGWLVALRERLAHVFGARRGRQELDEEMGFHLDRLTQRLRAEGMSRAEARRVAARQFGSVVNLREEVRDASGVRPLFDLLADLRVALRVPAVFVLQQAAYGLGVLAGAVRGAIRA